MSTRLPLVEIQGPTLPGRPDLPFWVLTASAPTFTDHTANDKKAPQEDRIHPLRTLLLDVATTRLDGKDWRLPRLMSLHVMAGDPKVFAEGGGKERLSVRFTKFWAGEQGINAIRTAHSTSVVLFRTFAEAQSQSAALQHVVVEPILDDVEKWPDVSSDRISVPRCRLVSGAIEILGFRDEMSWLLKKFILESKHKLPISDATILIRLTPDGIEIDASVPFPGSSRIPGRFLLAPGADEPRLHLLPDRLNGPDLESWQKAWRAITPATDTDEEAVTGLKVSARTGGRPPAFVWNVEHHLLSAQDLQPTVEVPAPALDVRLLSPEGPDGVDGEVTVTPKVYRLANHDPQLVPKALRKGVQSWDKKVVMLIAELQPKEPVAPATRLLLSGDDKTLTVRLAAVDETAKGVEHRCVHDEVALAAALRRAYGFADLQPGTPDRDRPLLAAFVPLDDGWAQLPVPNFPPVDVSKDHIVTPEQPVITNVLSGYLRFRQSGGLPQVLSVFPVEGTGDPDPLTVSEAPWAVTVEGAQSAALVVGLLAAPTGAKLQRAEVALDGPELSTRGLMWVSADRPDALEALPRIGAGAGVYFDVPLETLDIERKPAVQLSLAELAVKVTRRLERGTRNDALERTGLAVAVAFDRKSDWEQLAKEGRKVLEEAHLALLGKPSGEAAPPPLPPVRWQRHPRMPLAAEMPMTRGAASAVRPLESRDLVPFAVDVPKGEPALLLRFTWGGGAVFPRVSRHDAQPLAVRPIASWPWPVSQATQGPERGIALTAFAVPGAELAFAPDAKATAAPWPLLKFALRYDLPSLDEAFATATLPPQPPENALPEEREIPPPVPVPLAYDWVAMTAFWQDQERRHQLARVAHSYLAGYEALSVGKREVLDLVGGLKWKTDLGFQPPREETPFEPIPYGSAVVGDKDRPVSGDRALLGVSDTFDLDLKPGAGPIRVVGYAPSSFEEEGYLMDSRRTGVKPVERKGSMLFRPIVVKEPAGVEVTGLATLLAPVKVGGELALWLKDVPLLVKSGKGTLVTRPNGGDGDVDFSAWQDGRLPLSGFEWRLIPTQEEKAKEVFRLGRDRIPFHGFALEPLRLLSCVLDMATGAVDSAALEARVHLGPRSRLAADGNLVRLELRKDGAGLAIHKLISPAPLRFVLEDVGRSQRVVVAARWNWDADKGTREITVEGLTVALFGEDHELQGATLTASDPKVTIRWTRTEALPQPEGKGTLAVSEVVVETGVRPNGEGTKVSVKIKRRILLMPHALPAAAPTPSDVDAALRVDLVDDVCTVAFLGLTLPARFEEREGAFALTLAADVGQQVLLGGLPLAGKLSLGFVARVGAIDARGIADLSAGYLDGEIFAAELDKLDPRIRLRRVSFHAERRLLPLPALPEARERTWAGTIRLHGRLQLDSAIRWPKVDVKNDVGGRTPVLIQEEGFFDRVVYVLDGHALPFGTAARLHARRADAVWVTPVVSRHTLEDKDGKEVGTLTAIETIALGAAEAIIPKLDSDPVTFAPRYRELIENGKPGKAEKGMSAAGVGTVATVMSGALGARFRSDFWAHEPNLGLHLAGGFVGLLAGADGEDAPLVRLPVLAALDPKAPLAKKGAIEQRGYGAAVEVAWADGPRAREVIATIRGAVAPASASDVAIQAALLAGSRAAASRGLLPGDAVPAVLVEQCFAIVTPTAEGKPFEKYPYFIAAAVSLKSSIEGFETRPAPVVLSLLAGAGKRKNLAAAMVTRNLAIAAEAGGPGAKHGPEVLAELATVGEELSVRPWNGPAVADLEGIVPLGQVAGPAFADHVRPRAALLRTLEGAQWRYDSAELPRPMERARLVEPLRDRSYADAGRGYGLEPGDRPLRWLGGAEDGPMEPFRDAGDASPGDDTSGLAGMSRVMRLPAHAPRVEGLPRKPEEQPDDESSDRARLDLVWLAQTRAPVYLPLKLEDVEAPPIPWLAPGAPRARIPADDSLAEAFRKLDFDVEPDRVKNVQPVLPENATLASIGDRAGISLARIGRLETSVGPFKAFDGLHPRFGRAGQGGSWSARTERTPRPGRLPRNHGDPQRDRRPCATPLLAEEPLNALVGPADTVGGEPIADGKPEELLGAWTVTLVAAPEWNGMITESWDGTVQLYAEIDVAKLGSGSDDVVETLFRLLLPTVPDKQYKELRASASLVVGQTVLPFLRMHVETPKDTRFQSHAGVHRGVVRLFLDARPDDTSRSRGPALAAVAQALAAAPLPPMEIRFVVHPETRPRDTGNYAHPGISKLAAEEDLLAEGKDRAPVTLRLPLAPIVRSRGALPLSPTSLLFVDPSYNAGLSSAPAEERALISTPGAGVPETRGALQAVLYADRARVNRKASVTFMVDISFEKKLDELGRQALPTDVDGDVRPLSGAFELRIAVLSKRTGRRRDLFVAKPSPAAIPEFKPPAPPQVSLARVYELSLANLIEADATAAVLEAGDLLELQTAEKEAGTVHVEVAALGVSNSPVEPVMILVEKLHETAVARTLRIVLTDEPVVEPPPSLFAALVRRTAKNDKGDEVASLSLPLYAQSPLPWRVDLRDAKADFRAGLMRRAATFVWTLARPLAERERTGIHIVKADRNGQTHLPTEESEFIKARTLSD